jgi:hypothetical protein
MYDIIVLFLLYLSIFCLICSIIPSLKKIASHPASPDLVDASLQDDPLNPHSCGAERDEKFTVRHHLSPCLSCDHYVDPMVCASCARVKAAKSGNHQADPS